MKIIARTLVLSLLAAACADPGEEASTESVDTEASSNSEAFTVVDEVLFRQLVPSGAQVTHLADGMVFVEGPVWIDENGGYLVFSDLRVDELKRWDASDSVRTFRSPSGVANGNTLDLEGRLVSAQHEGRVSRTMEDGTLVTLVEEHLGNRLSSPNDVVFRSDGTLWFTDPDYGLDGREQETPGNYVYRFDDTTSTLTAVITDMVRPNGLCFSPDETRLYVADSGAPRHIRAFDVSPDGTVAEGEVFTTIDRGAPDGIRCDELGNVWSSSGDGAQIFAPSGELIARILLPESAANLAFGGEDGTTVFFTARTSLYSIPSLVHDARFGR